MTPNYELLKGTYATIDGIPEEAVHLASIVSRRGESPACGTACCAAGSPVHILGLTQLHDEHKVTSPYLSPQAKGEIQFPNSRHPTLREYEQLRQRALWILEDKKQ